MSRTSTPANLFLGKVVRASVTPQLDQMMSYVAFADTDSAEGTHRGSPSTASIATGATPVGWVDGGRVGSRISIEESPLQASLTLLPHDSPPNENLDATAEFTVPPPMRRQTVVSFSNPGSQPPAAERKDSVQQLYRIREATVEDAESIVGLTKAVDMTNAESFLWPLEDLRDRIARRDPMIVIAVTTASFDNGGAGGGAKEGDGGETVVAGAAGIDTIGMSKPLRVLSVGSRVSLCPANEEYDIPKSYCMCRGLLIHPDHQGAGLGSRLHRYRIEALAQLCPEIPAVVLGARGSTIVEAVATLGPMLQAPRETEETPQFTKEAIFQFTFHTSQGVVHLAHSRERDGWRFVGVATDDGGPVWCTSLPLADIVNLYPQSRRQTAVMLEPIQLDGHAG